MLGAIVGDIVGSVYEWDRIKTKTFSLFSSQCFFTDDTVMTCAVASAFLKGQPKEEAQFKSILVAEMRSFGERYPGRGYGGRFAEWLISDSPEPYSSYGNGSAMRVSPAAWAARTLDEAEKYAEITAVVTHNHPEGIRGAKATAAAIFMARTKEKKNTIRDYIERNYEYDLRTKLDAIRPTYRFDESCQHTVPQAISAFLEARSYEDAIRNAISLGGDSDTLAAIAGSIAEAYYGIPTTISCQARAYLDDDLYTLYLAFKNRFIKPKQSNSTKAKRGTAHNVEILSAPYIRQDDIGNYIRKEDISILSASLLSNRTGVYCSTIVDKRFGLIFVVKSTTGTNVYLEVRVLQQRPQLEVKMSVINEVINMTDILNKAIIYAVNAHKNTFRKGTTTPYILHPMEAAAIVGSMTDDEEVIAAAVLHDVLEDTTTTVKLLQAELGERITRLVQAESEDKRENRPAAETWKIRKQETIDALMKEPNLSVKMIALGDKLSNIRAMYNDYQEIGDKLWERFNQKDKSEHNWYYRSIAEATKELAVFPAWQEYDRLVREVFER